MSETVEAVVRAAREEQDVDVERLTIAERWEVARALGWDRSFSRTYLIEWCGGPEPVRQAGPDYELLILARQEADQSYWG